VQFSLIRLMHGLAQFRHQPSCCDIVLVAKIIIRVYINNIQYISFIEPKVHSNVTNYCSFVPREQQFLFTDYELVRLPEDATLCGFTPLMYNDQEPIYTSKETDMVSFLSYVFVIDRHNVAVYG
jgi:hypothetical protein